MLGVCMSVCWVCIFCVCMCVCISVCVCLCMCACVCAMYLRMVGQWCVYYIIYTNMRVRLFVCVCMHVWVVFIWLVHIIVLLKVVL